MALDPGHGPHQTPQCDHTAGLQAQHWIDLRRQLQPSVPTPGHRVPVETAHAGQVQRSGQAGSTAGQLLPCTRCPEQVAQASLEQTPLRRLDEEVGGARTVGTADGFFVVQASKHQHGHVLHPRQASQALAGGKPIQAGYQGIQHHDVRYLAHQVLQRRRSAAALGHRKAAPPQCQRGHQEIDLIVIDKKHGRDRLVRAVLWVGDWCTHASKSCGKHSRNRRPGLRRLPQARFEAAECLAGRRFQCP